MLRIFSLIVVSCLLLLSIGERSVKASGDEFNFNGSDLNIDVSSVWASCREGGYYPIRARIRNLGPARTITLEFRPIYQNRQPIVTRDVTLAQNATSSTTLLIPMVSTDAGGEFRVIEQGRVLNGMSQHVSLADINTSYDQGLEMLIISPKMEDSVKFSEASSRKYASGHSYYSSYSSSKAETIPPTNLPENWLAYTGLELLAIPFATLNQGITPEARRAILQWVESGGTLLVYDVSASNRLDQLLGWDQRKFVGPNWNAVNGTPFRVLQLPRADDNTVTETEKFDPGQAWAINDNTLMERGFGLGKIIRMPFNPFPGTVSHWSWFLEQFDSNNALSWAKRYEISPRKGNRTFLHFPIPGVGDVPVMAFLVLITLFTIIIGPVNYIYYMRKKRLAMLLVTVPVLAFGSSLLLLGYSTVANGVSVKSRVRSITVLDQAQKTSISLNRVAYFAGMAPSGGLKFEPETAVFPIWSGPGGFESARVNWSDIQNFQTGWLRSRTRTQFLTITQRDQRGRLDWTGGGDESQIANGLEWQIGMLFAVDEKGDFWFTENLKPGASAQMRRGTEAELDRLRKLIGEQDLGLPEGVDEVQVWRSSRDYWSYSDDENYQGSYGGSQQEQLIRQFLYFKEAPDPQRKRYYAVLDQNPQLDLGLQKSQERNSLYLLLGYFD